MGRLKRSSEILALSESFYNLTQEGQNAPDDVIMLLLHRLRDSLRDGPCPDCLIQPLAALAALDAAAEDPCPTSTQPEKLPTLKGC